MCREADVLAWKMKTRTRRGDLAHSSKEYHDHGTQAKTKSVPTHGDQEQSAARSSCLEDRTTSHSRSRSSELLVYHDPAEYQCASSRNNARAAHITPVLADTEQKRERRTQRTACNG